MDADYDNVASNETADDPGSPDVAIAQEWTIARTNLPGDTMNPIANASSDAKEDEINETSFRMQARTRVRTNSKNRGARAQKSFFCWMLMT